MNFQIETAMNHIVELATKFYDIDCLEVQVSYSKLYNNMGWQAYVQKMIFADDDSLISVDPLYEPNQFGYPPVGEGETISKSLEDLIEAFERAIARKESFLSEKEWNEMAEAPLMFGCAAPIDR